MDPKQTPYLLGLAAATVFMFRGAAPAAGPQPAAGRSSPPPYAAEHEGGEAADQERSAADNQTATESTRRHYLRTYREFLGIEPPKPRAEKVLEVRGTVAQEAVRLDISDRPPETPADARELQRIASIAHQEGYVLEFMIALVADPIDSGLAADFDLETRAVQSALADEEYLLDRHWFPWDHPKAVEDKEFRETAGVMLFRRTDSADAGDSIRRAGAARSRSLLTVFLVGETPKLGIHKRAFHGAVEFLVQLHNATCQPAPGSPPAANCNPALIPEIPVLGPTYSGTAESLRLAMDEVSRPVHFRLVSGSAAAPEVQSILERTKRESATFSRTILDEDELVERSLNFFKSDMGWSLDRAALLVESDTAYGGSILNPRSSTAAAEHPLLAKITKVRFPTDLYALRNAWEQSSAAAPASEAGGAPKALASPRTALDVSLADRQPPVDVVAELSPLTTRIYDVTLANLGRELARERFSYIGILASDVRDELFLAEQVRRWTPGVILFVFEGNLLYVHPQYNVTMFGALAASSFPLVPEGASELLSPATPSAQFRRQFASELQEGVYLAVLKLLGVTVSSPSVWISASGNYSLWPVAHLRQPKKRATDSARPSPASLGPAVAQTPPPPFSRPPITLSGFQLLCLASALCVAGHRLRRDAYLPQARLAEAQVRVRHLLSAATAVLSVMAAGMLALNALPIWLNLTSPDSPAVAAAASCADSPSMACGWWHAAPPFEWLLTAVLAAALAQLLWGLGEILGLYRRNWARIALVLTLLVTTSLPLLALHHLSRSDLVLSCFRARSFSGGMSPLVSLAWLGAAAVFWLYVEVQRRLLYQRIQAGWPLGLLEDDREPHLAGCRRQAESIDCLLRATSPVVARFWLAAGPILLLVAMSLGGRMQPIAETHAYGWVVLTLGELLTFLALLSCARFLGAWLVLRQILKRLTSTTLLAALKRVSSQVGWNPTQFSYYVPSLPAMKPTVDLVQKLIDSKLVTCPPHFDTPQRLLQEILKAASEKDFPKELSHRRSLNILFAKAEVELAPALGRRAVTDFYALRLIAYVHRILVQLRYAVMGAIGTCLGTIMATATYAFEPKSSTLLVLCVTLAAMSAATMTVFVQMERDTTLSTIGRTEAGEISFNWAFWSKLLIYGVVPVLGLAASQFPALGRLTGGLLDMLGRVVGGG